MLMVMLPLVWLKYVSPLYTALIVCWPGESCDDVVVYVAWPSASTTTAPGNSGAPLSSNVTVPVGVPAELLTLAVKVTC